MWIAFFFFSQFTVCGSTKFLLHYVEINHLNFQMELWCCWIGDDRECWQYYSTSRRIVFNYFFLLLQFYYHQGVYLCFYISWSFLIILLKRHQGVNPILRDKIYLKENKTTSKSSKIHSWQDGVTSIQNLKVYNQKSLVLTQEETVSSETPCCFPSILPTQWPTR